MKRTLLAALFAGMTFAGGNALALTSIQMETDVEMVALKVANETVQGGYKLIKMEDVKKMLDAKEATAAPKPGSVSLKDAKRNLYVEWQQVYDDVLSRRDPNVVLVDARPHGMYTGAVIKHAVQGGHIPGALNVVSLDGTDGQSQKWFDETRLAAMYKDVPKDKTVYLYCHDGFRMSLGWVQLKSLGYQDVRVLDGGWGIWDRAFTLPVVAGEKPYDEEFAL